VGLAWRQQRGALLAWSAALGLCGALIGSMGDSMQDMVRDNPALADYLAVTGGGSLIDSYQATFALIMTLMVAGYAIWAAGRVISEESEGRAELVAAGPVSRVRLLVSNLAVVAAGILVLLVVSGLSSGVVYAAVVGDWGQGLRVLLAPLAYLPAIAVLVGVLVLAYGWAPRRTWVGWLALAFEAVVGWLGGILDLPERVYDFSVFDRVPHYPAENLSAVPLLVMGAAGLALLGLGLAGFRRRDLG
jgi:ABC-2 type transport system permease protein